MGDTSGTQILELADLDDRICVLEEMIEDLHGQKHSKGELEVKMNQYVLLEESIQQGLEYLLRNVKSVQDKKQLDSSSDKFNKLNSDFQENWNDEFWRCYDMIKGGKKQNKGIKPDLNTRVADLQDLASTLNKSIKDDKKEENPNPEQATSTLPEPTRSVDPDPIARKCCNCLIF